MESCLTSLLPVLMCDLPSTNPVLPIVDLPNNEAAESSPRATKRVDHRKLPRQRLLRSCKTCHSRKVKCDLSWPHCGACDKLGLKCRWDERSYGPAGFLGKPRRPSRRSSSFKSNKSKSGSEDGSGVDGAYVEGTDDSLLPWSEPTSLALNSMQVSALGDLVNPETLAAPKRAGQQDSTTGSDGISRDTIPFLGDLVKPLTLAAQRAGQQKSTTHSDAIPFHDPAQHSPSKDIGCGPIVAQKEYELGNSDRFTSVYSFAVLVSRLQHSCGSICTEPMKFAQLTQLQSLWRSHIYQEEKESPQLALTTAASLRERQKIYKDTCALVGMGETILYLPFKVAGPITGRLTRVLWEYAETSLSLLERHGDLMTPQMFSAFFLMGKLCLYGRIAEDCDFISMFHRVKKLALGQNGGVFSTALLPDLPVVMLTDTAFNLTLSPLAVGEALSEHMQQRVGEWGFISLSEAKWNWPRCRGLLCGSLFSFEILLFRCLFQVDSDKMRKDRRPFEQLEESLVTLVMKTIHELEKVIEVVAVAGPVDDATLTLYHCVVGAVCYLYNYTRILTLEQIRARLLASYDYMIGDYRMGHPFNSHLFVSVYITSSVMYEADPDYVFASMSPLLNVDVDSLTSYGIEMKGYLLRIFSGGSMQLHNLDGIADVKFYSIPWVSPSEGR